MFPIHDRRGRVIGFGGRVIENGEPKYLNSPETEVFHKGRELYGLHEALAAKRKLDSLLVVEGYMDVVALHQFGLPNVVATLGTAVTREHLDLLFRQVPEVVFCFDGDAAGKRAAWRALENALPLVEGNRAVQLRVPARGPRPGQRRARIRSARAFLQAARQFGLADYLLDTLKLEVDLTTGDGRARLIERAKPYPHPDPEPKPPRRRGAHARRTSASSTRTSSAANSALTANRGYRAAPRAGAQPFHQPLPGRAGAGHAAANAGAGRATRRRAGGVSAARNCATAHCCSKYGPQSRRNRPPPPPRSWNAGATTRWKSKLAALAALDLGIPDSAFESQFAGALARLRAKAEEQRFARIKSIPIRTVERGTARHRA
jgi:DNA primase